MDYRLNDRINRTGVALVLRSVNNSNIPIIWMLISSPDRFHGYTRYIRSRR
jgi:hypothetical protein